MKLILSKILDVFASLWNGFDHWYTRFDLWWAKLRYWQKGAILGAVLHVFSLLLLAIPALLFIPKSSPPGSGDMGPAGAWLLYIFYGLIEILPSSVLYLLTGIKYASEPRTILIWVLYLIYATLFYALVGIAISKIIGQLKK